MIADSPSGHPIADCTFALRDAPQPAAAWCCAWFFRSESEKTKHIKSTAVPEHVEGLPKAKTAIYQATCERLH